MRLLTGLFFVIISVAEVKFGRELFSYQQIKKYAFATLHVFY